MNRRETFRYRRIYFAVLPITLLGTPGCGGDDAVETSDRTEALREEGAHTLGDAPTAPKFSSFAPMGTDRRLRCRNNLGPVPGRGREDCGGSGWRICADAG